MRKKTKALFLFWIHSSFQESGLELDEKGRVSAKFLEYLYELKKDQILKMIILKF